MDLFTRACAGKHGYPDFDTAKSVIRKDRNKEKRGGMKLNAYRCPFCNKWHVGGSRRSVTNGA